MGGTLGDGPARNKFSSELKKGIKGAVKKLQSRIRARGKSKKKKKNGKIFRVMSGVGSSDTENELLLSRIDGGTNMRESGMLLLLNHVQGKKGKWGGVRRTHGSNTTHNNQRKQKGRLSWRREQKLPFAYAIRTTEVFDWTEKEILGVKFRSVKRVEASKGTIQQSKKKRNEGGRVGSPMLMGEKQKGEENEKGVARWVLRL